MFRWRGEPKKPAPTKEQVAQWVRQLGDDDFEKRENASKQLWEAGRLAEAPLKEAVMSDDAEVKRRSQELLDKFKWGIYPDTPAKIVEMIQRYRAGADPGSKAAIAQELLDAGEDGRTAFARISAAEDKKVFDDVRAKAAVAYVNRGEACRNKKDYDNAIKHYSEGIRLNPKYVPAYIDRGMAYKRKKEYDKAIKDYSEAIQLDPASANRYSNLAWLLATCPKDSVRDGKKAVELATIACKLANGDIANDLENLAAAHAECGNFQEAIKWQKKALEVGFANKESTEQARQRQKLFEEGKPYRE